MVYITGDIHGNIHDERFKFINKLNKDDIIIFLGDFGFDWSPKHIKEYNVPCKTLFIAGNHENYDILKNLPETELYGDTVKILKDNVYYLLTGNYYTIENKTFLIFGGATSIDRDCRIPFLSWWPDEVPTWEEFEKTKTALQNHNNKVNYFLTHTCSRSTSKDFFNYMNGFNDGTEDMIEELEKQIEGKYIHYFGHHHNDIKKDNQICMYTKIKKLF